MTRFLLIRHAAAGTTDRIAGRMAGGTLTAEGRAQAAALARRLERRQIRAIYSSPQERARETALVLAGGSGPAVQIVEQLDEIDYGDWTGRTLEELAPLPQWQAFNRVRSCARVPNGESMLEAQARAVDFLERLRALHPGETVAAISHADVIRALIVYYLGVPVDLMLRFEIGPASASIVEIGAHGPLVRCVNNTDPL